MPNDSREGVSETVHVLLAWGMPAEAREDLAGTAAWWLSGGMMLLLWTALALVLVGA